MRPTRPRAGVGRRYPPAGPEFSHPTLPFPHTQTAAAGETVVAESEASTSGGSPAPHANGKALVNGGALNGAALNGKALDNGSAPAAGALVAGVAANGATVSLGDVDASAVLAIEDNIDACGAGQLEACAMDR